MKTRLISEFRAVPVVEIAALAFVIASVALRPSLVALVERLGQ